MENINFCVPKALKNFKIFLSAEEKMFASKGNRFFELDVITAFSVVCSRTFAKKSF